MSLYVPKKIRVGFQNRQDTYTKKLGYVVYWDDLGVLRKESSWEKWRDSSIPPEEFDNEPTSGFVLNKDAGGGRGWNGRNTWVRVWDPRNFEFEISVENLLYIMSWCDCSKGKGIEGELIYGWDGSNHVLLPVTSTDFKEARKFDEFKAEKISLKDLKVGERYVMRKDNQRMTYLGRHKCRHSRWYTILTDPIKEPHHIFCDGSNIRRVKSASTIAGSLNEVDPDLQSKMNFFDGSPLRSLPIDMSVTDGWNRDFYFEDGKIYSIQAYPYFLDEQKRGKSFIKNEIILNNGLMEEVSTTLKKDINSYENKTNILLHFRNGESYSVYRLNHITGVEK